ncbi:MAG: hypothetical protein QNJ54_20010 [Prochloraceae cyanobacterium]|nr:hypothetical protein [Prochloraceae cyanobacterium]
MDGSRTKFIQPLYFPSRRSIITILTGNTTDRSDKAGLQQGRIHAQFTFDRVLKS